MRAHHRGNTVRTILFCADIADGTRTGRKHEVKTMKPLLGLLVRKLLTRGIAQPGSGG